MDGLKGTQVDLLVFGDKQAGAKSRKVDGGDGWAG